MLIHWAVVPTRLPLVLRRCPACGPAGFRAHGKFRVNANHKLLDAWLLALCTGCGDTTRITILERAHVRSIRPELLDRMHANDPALAAELLQDGVVRRRNHIALDWTDAWRLDTGDDAPPDRGAVEVSVRFGAPIAVRPLRLIADGFGLSRAEAERLLAEGRLVSPARLTGRTSNDFGFLLKR
ncbi:DUF1062 domain-containing protein [Streptomyces sp. NBC_00525]|uniref:DUF1062 domain-containing protein n=1 Tax=Streptomyces sp. NBC_00525 TaxID=2903660 RepID=UPI002E7FE55D|nr:DUF1062 domain-containing protein [Streptomyces sp. NBC_00525]WUC94660.1 DUF1062 domain-containing protein [Streptomyces sp. NBC_00525]